MSIEMLTTAMSNAKLVNGRYTKILYFNIKGSLSYIEYIFTS